MIKNKDKQPQKKMTCQNDPCTKMYTHIIISDSRKGPLKMLNRWLR